MSQITNTKISNIFYDKKEKVLSIMLNADENALIPGFDISEENIETLRLTLLKALFNGGLFDSGKTQIRGELNHYTDVYIHCHDNFMSVLKETPPGDEKQQVIVNMNKDDWAELLSELIC